MSAPLPERYQEQPELVNAVREARAVQMETEDTPFAIEWLMEHYPMSIESAQKAMDDVTFRYAVFYPHGHPGWEAIFAEQRAKGRRSYNLKKLRPQVIDRDDGRCQGCQKRVTGRDATIDHKDPEGPETLENLHLLCRKCNTIKGKRTWEEYQRDEAEWATQLQQRQNARPDFVCKRTGLSVRGRSWKEAGCTTPDVCLMEQECDNGGYESFAAEMDARMEEVERGY